MQVPAELATVAVTKGLSVSGEGNSMTGSGVDGPFEVVLPPDVNPVDRVEVDGSTVVIHCRYRHGLFVVQNGKLVLAPRHGPLLLAPSAHTFDDLQVAGDASYVSAQAFRLPYQHEEIKALRAKRSAICYRAGATTASLVRAVSDRLPASIQCTHTPHEAPHVHIGVAGGSGLELAGSLLGALGLHRSGCSSSNYVGFDSTAEPLRIETSGVETLEELCAATEAAAGPADVDGDGFIDLELPHKCMRVPLPPGLYDLSSVAGCLNSALRAQDVGITVSAVCDDRRRGLSFEAPFVFGVRMDTIEGLSSWQLGYMPCALRGCCSYRAAGPEGSSLPHVWDGPRIRVGCCGGNVCVGAEPMPPCAAVQTGAQLVLDRAILARAGTVLMLGYADSAKYTTVVVDSVTSPTELLLSAYGGRAGRCLVHALSWAPHVDARIAWLQQDSLRLQLGTFVTSTPAPSIMIDTGTDVDAGNIL